MLHGNKRLGAPGKTRTAKELATEFLADYQDPEISKRLFFDRWADRRGAGEAMKTRIWGEVVRLSRERGMAIRSVKTRWPLERMSGEE